MEHFIENGKKLTNKEWACKVFDYDVEQIRNADCILAIYHGHYSDSGTALELGFAFVGGIPFFQTGDGGSCPLRCSNMTYRFEP